MKTITFFSTKTILVASLLLLSFINYAQKSETFNDPNVTNTFTVPNGVTTVTAEAWGAGGKGGTRTNKWTTGGGGGGAYAKRATILVLQGSTYNVEVGKGSSTNADGGSSWFMNSLTVLAQGGKSVANNTVTGANGGAFIGSIGDLGSVFAGGKGSNASGNASSSDSGGGGSSASNGFSGVDATNINGATAPLHGGNGGDAKTSNGDGDPGNSPGGGGGGAFRSNGSTRYGGIGGDGQVVITYTCPTYALTSPASANGPFCGTSAAEVTLVSTSMVPGDYIITYDLSGATTASDLTAAITFTLGLPNTGSFITAMLAEGTTTVTVKSITSAGCTSIITSNNVTNIDVAPETTADAGTAVETCALLPAINITAGASATNASSVLWSTSGTGTFSNADSLTLCTYNPSAVDKASGSVTLTLTAVGIAPCADVIATKTLTISPKPIAVAGSNFSTCASTTSINITTGSNANYNAIWTGNGSGTFTDATSLTTCTYSPSAADVTAGSVIFTLTVSGTGACSAYSATSTKKLTIAPTPISVAGTPIVTCSSSNAINITAGASAANHTSVLWTSSGSGTFVSASSLTFCTYNPSAADKLAGSVTLTLSANKAGCTSAISTKTLTINPVATSFAGPSFSACFTSGNINITGGATATNYNTVTWTSNGSGTLSNANSLTSCTYSPSAGDISAGTVTFTLTATGTAPCGNVISMKTVTIDTAPVAEAGTAIATCSTSGGINITAGAVATNAATVLWTSNGTGTFTNANSLTLCTYNPSPADKIAGTVTLTLTATNPGCGSDSSIKTLTIYQTPTVTGTTPATRTGTGTLILGATASTGSLYWYAAATGGSSLGFGTSFMTPVISATTTYYVEALNGTCFSAPRTAVIATVLFPEIDVRGNATSIVSGDTTPSTADWTDFGATNLTRTFTIQNTNSGNLSIGAITITGAHASDFSVTTLPSSTVAPSSSTTFVITFNPTLAGTRSAIVSIDNNDTDENPYTFAIQGTGVNREIDIQGNAITIVDGDNTPTTADWTDFSTVTATRTYTIKNTGNIILTLGTITITGANAADFAVTSAPAATVGAYSSTTFTVTFSPNAILNRTAIITVPNNDSNESPYDFVIQGYGVIPEIDIQGNGISITDGDNTPSNADWTNFGSATVTRTFTIYNLGNTNLILGAYNFTGANPTEFAVTTPPNNVVPAFGSTTFEITFSPTTVGTRTAMFNIVNNDSNENPYNFQLQGTGIAQEIEILGNATVIVDGDTTPTTADWTDFSNVVLTRTFTIKNTGNILLTRGAITFSGANAGDFSITSMPAANIGAFGSTTFDVTFNPGGIGTRAARINIVNNDSNENPYDFSLQGTGGIPEINIKSQFGVNIVDGDTTPSNSDQTNFGDVSMDGGTVYVNMIIENTGTGALSIGAANFTGPNAADFAISMAPASSIAAGGSSRLRISFTPTTVGVKTAMFSIINNDSNENPYNFSLSGLGVQTYKDTDGDGITDNKDLDDDNDGIIDTKEQIDGLAYPLTSLVEYTFLNETFGAGTTRGAININTPGASTTYCLEEGYGTSCYPTLTSLNDGEYAVTYKITGTTSSDPENLQGLGVWYGGLDHTPGDVAGRMAVFNASYPVGTFYETRIDGVIPNVPISYSFWALNILTPSTFPGSILPDITVEFLDTNYNIISTFNTGKIGRCDLGSFTDNSCASSNWLQFSTSVNLGNVNSFIIRFKNNATGGNGNDLALDDIKIVQNYIDTDGDGIANIFDLDDDNDGIPDIEEAGYKAYSNGKATMDLSSTATWIDVNRNGLHDAIDAQIAAGTYMIPDTDGDSVPNYLDLDSDNDTFFDVDEAGILNGDGDINGDGKGDLADTDRDGVLDLYDNAVGFGTNFRPFAMDTDGNGIADYLQLDSDNDGVNDIKTGLYGSLDANNDGKIDGSTDVDKDGITDTFDTNTAVIGSPRDLNRKLFLDFDGRNDYGQGAAVLGGLPTVSMMAWINLNNAFSSEGVVIGQSNFQIKINTARKLQVVVNGVTKTYSSVALNKAQWYHVGATLGDGEIKLYLNGENVLADAMTGGINADATMLTIGRNPAASNGFFKGKIDEVRIFNTNLTDAQFQRTVYQEIQNSASQVRGLIVPKDVGALPWTNVLRYYRMDAYKDDIIDDLTTASIDAGSGMRIFNNKIIRTQQAPMPFITERTGNFATAVNSPTNEVRGMDIMDQDWSIVQVKHNITETANNVDLGMFVDLGVTVTANNNIKIQNDWFLRLDGKIDLQGRSQLLQTKFSDLHQASGGSIERDQQGQTNLFNYNYWCAPVGIQNTTSNNNTYTVNGMMKDGTNPANPQNINWTTGYNGAPTSPITLSSYWIFKFQNTSPVYANWTNVGPNGTLLAGQGYTLKGSGAASATQNFTFVGKPNNGIITSTIAANNLNLSGNPYPSALDADEFIAKNASSTTGALYFWEHFSTNTSHVLINYQGGYATYNLVGGIPPVAPAGISTAGTSSRVPGRFIPVGQGFFVNGSATGGTITFNNEQRAFIREENSASNIMFKQDFQQGPKTTSAQFNNAQDTFTEKSNIKIRLGFDAANYHRQILLGFMNELATSGIDPGYDAPHIDNQPSDMYFLNEETKLIIAGEGYFNADNIYPVGVKTAAQGTIKFALDGTENFEENQAVYIYDNATQIYHDISEDAFEIEMPAGTVNDRFTLRFKNPELLANNNFDLNASVLTAFYTNDDRMINVTNTDLDTEVTSVALYNILGQFVQSWDVENGHQVKIQLPVKQTSTGTYIMKVQTSKGDISKKIIIK